jgi:hypothetical protein
MKSHQPIAAGGPRLSRSVDLTLRTFAVALLLAGAALLLADLLSAGIAFPLIAIALALVVMLEADRTSAAPRTELNARPTANLPVRTSVATVVDADHCKSTAVTPHVSART